MPGTSMAIVKELQSLAAFKARETYHKKESAKKTELVEYMYDAFHGNSEKDIASQAKLLINGHGAYAGLFDPLEAVTDASATNLSSQTRTIKKLITNDSKSLHTVGTNRKEDITLSLLKRKSKKSPVAIQGSALYDAAQQVHANGKKALAIGLKYLDSRKGHPSGTNDDDFYAHVLSEMYKQSNSAAVSLADDGEPKEAVIEESDVDSQITASDMAAEDTADGAITGGVEGSAEASLETYGNGKFFKGFAAFVLFGPLAPESEQSDLFKFQDFLKPSEDKKVAGRDAARKEELQDKKREREASTSGVRGSTVASRTELVQKLACRRVSPRHVASESINELNSPEPSCIMRHATPRFSLSSNIMPCDDDVD